jgi:predicted permease
MGLPLPLSGYTEAGSFQIEGAVLQPGDPGPHADRGFLTPGYLESLSIPLKQGRFFTAGDHEKTELVAIIDDTLAKQYWPSQNPLGQRITTMNSTFRIVGVVGHVIHDNLAADSGKGVVYLDLLQKPLPFATVVVKTSGDPVSVASAIREAVRSVDPNQAVHTFRSMDENVALSLATRKFGMRLLTFFAGTALFLAALGLYGVISYSVAQRTREIGIRMALGARPASVMRLVLGQGVRLAAIGVAIGIAAAGLTGQFLASQLFQTSAFDPITVSGMAILLLGAAVFASYLPARRAVRVDPVVTLRCD